LVRCLRAASFVFVLTIFFNWFLLRFLISSFVRFSSKSSARAFPEPKCSDYSRTRVSKGSLYRVSPDKIPPKCLGWSNLWLSWMLSLIEKKYLLFLY
jgi:hypothetical protein